jgi:hypothetical protein
MDAPSFASLSALAWFRVNLQVIRASDLKLKQMHFEPLKTAGMRELRVYIMPSETQAAREERVTFYSRRADGPLYCWLYEEEKGRWRVSRVRLSVLTLRALSVANWKAVPLTLQARLNEHYLE